jgi:peptidyl-prolyl cis-trans isomerase SurA
MNRLLSCSRLAIALGFSCVLLTLPAGAAPLAVEVDSIVAVVNNEVITYQQLRARIDQTVRQLRRQEAQVPPPEVLKRQLLERLIVERVQLQLARDSAVRVEDIVLERAIARIADSNRLDVGQLRVTLEKDGIAWERFRDQVRTEILLTRLREREVDSRIVVTDAEVDNFLSANPDAFSNEEYQLAHILLRVQEGATPEQIERLRARTESVMARLRAGEEFSVVAAAVSDAPDGISGGNMGWRRIDRLPSMFTDLARSLKPGEVAAPLRSAAGIHIVKLVARRGGEAAQQFQVEQTHARHILIKTSEVLSDAEAEARLRGLRERLVNGVSFETLARANSSDLSAAKGGDLGWLSAGDTVPEFEQAMNALRPGEVSPPVRTQFGWHLIRVDQRRVQDVTDERKRNVARAALRERKIEQAQEEWVRQLRDSAYVDYRLERE